MQKLHGGLFPGEEEEEECFLTLLPGEILQISLVLKARNDNERR